MKTFSASLAFCAGISPVIGEIPAQKASDAELWCFLWSAPERRWFDTQSRSIGRHCNDGGDYYALIARQILGHGLRFICIDAVLSFYCKRSYNGYVYTVINILGSKTVIV